MNIDFTPWVKFPYITWTLRMESINAMTKKNRYKALPPLQKTYYTLNQILFLIQSTHIMFTKFDDYQNVPYVHKGTRHYN